MEVLISTTLAADAERFAAGHGIEVAVLEVLDESAVLEVLDESAAQLGIQRPPLAAPDTRG